MTRVARHLSREAAFLYLLAGAEAVMPVAVAELRRGGEDLLDNWCRSWRLEFCDDLAKSAFHRAVAYMRSREEGTPLPHPESTSSYTVGNALIIVPAPAIAVATARIGGISGNPLPPPPQPTLAEIAEGGARWFSRRHPHPEIYGGTVTNKPEDYLLLARHLFGGESIRRLAQEYGNASKQDHNRKTVRGLLQRMAKHLGIHLPTSRP